MSEALEHLKKYGKETLQIDRITKDKVGSGPNVRSEYYQHRLISRLNANPHFILPHENSCGTFYMNCLGRRSRILSQNTRNVVFLTFDSAVGVEAPQAHPVLFWIDSNRHCGRPRHRRWRDALGG